VSEGPSEHHGIWKASLRDRTTTRLTRLEGRRGALGYRYSFDDRYFYFTWVEHEGDIWVMNVANRRPQVTPQTPVRTNVFARMICLAVLVVGLTLPARADTIDDYVDRQTQTLRLPGLALAWFAAARVVTLRNHDLWKLSLDRGQVSRLTKLQGRRGTLGQVFTTDGRYLYFTWREDDGDIWVMDVVKKVSN